LKEKEKRKKEKARRGLVKKCEKMRNIFGKAASIKWFAPI
jgi:hypothetical protein